ncbi:MAG: hypothetical protein JOZ05_09955 [Acetobacteraceae bacterium]|nr:hypothetical protein [Acetobacteraceae bacterium]
MDDDFDPTPEGLVRCLQVLAEEAACLSLTRTFAAVQDAIAMCREESGARPFAAALSAPGRFLH